MCRTSVSVGQVTVDLHKFVTVCLLGAQMDLSLMYKRILTSSEVNITQFCWRNTKRRYDLQKRLEKSYLEAQRVRAGSLWSNHAVPLLRLYPERAQAPVRKD